MPNPLTTYRVCRRCTVRTKPDPRAQQLSRMGPTKDGAPRLIQGREVVPGWIEWVSEAGDRMGYIKAGVLRALQARLA